MSEFWAKKTNPVQKPWEQPLNQGNANQPLVLDEEVMQVLQEDPNVDIFEEEEDDAALIMNDANLRLEQGRLYQMVLQGDIFADTNADPKAIRNVQREIRKFVRERMETMLGIRQEQVAQQPIVSSPFNDLEVTALKMVASKVTKGETEKVSQAPVAPTVTAPKKDGINSISGNVRPSALPTPVKGTTAKSQAPKPSKSAIAANPEESALQKPIDQMTPEELATYNKAAEERSARKRSALPTNMVPHPTPQALEMMYTGMASQMPIKLVPSSS